MTISNKQTLRLKKTVVNGRNQTVYHAKIYRPRELPQLVIDENEADIEVIADNTSQPNANSVVTPEKGVQVKTIQNVVVVPDEPLPTQTEIKVEKAVEKVITRRARKSVSNEE